MVDKVVGIHGGRVAATDEPNIALIEMLENVLAKAKTGELQSFIGTGFVVDGGRLTLWADFHKNVYEMQGSLSWLQHEYVARVTGLADAL